jgi:hypothetical protein
LHCVSVGSNCDEENSIKKRLIGNTDFPSSSTLLTPPPFQPWVEKGKAGKRAYAAQIAV